MTSKDLDNLARLRLAATTGQLPRDLALWALERIEPAISRTDRVRRRDRALRLASYHLVGTRTGIAKELERLIAAAAARDGATLEEVPCGLQLALRQALEADRNCPRSWRHLARILR